MDYAVQVTVKPGDQPMINVRVDDPRELDEALGMAIDAVPKAMDLQRAMNSPGVALLERELGGREIPDGAPPGFSVQTQYQPVPQAQPATPSWLEQPSQAPQWAAPNSTPPSPQNTICSRCNKAPICRDKACGTPCDPTPRAAGNYWIHDCRNTAKGHGGWCNTGTP